MNISGMLDLIYGIDLMVMESTIAVCNEIDKLTRKKYIMEHYTVEDKVFVETAEEVNGSIFQEGYGPIKNLDMKAIELSEFEKWKYDFNNMYKGEISPLMSIAKTNRCLAELALMAYNSNIKAKEDADKKTYGTWIDASNLRYVDFDKLQQTAGYKEKSMAIYLILVSVSLFAPKSFINKYYTSLGGELKDYGGESKTSLGAVNFAFTLPELSARITEGDYKKKTTLDKLTKIREKCKTNGTKPETDSEYISLTNWIQNTLNTTEDGLRREWNEAINNQHRSAKNNPGVFGWHINFNSNEPYNMKVIKFLETRPTTMYTGSLPNLQSVIEKIATYFELK